MRFPVKLFIAMVVLGAARVDGAVKDYPVKVREVIQEADNRILYHPMDQRTLFRVEIVDDSQGVKSESDKNGYPFITASPGERYSVRLYNPLPVRVAVNLTVDGLNSITGQPSGIEDGQKWLIEPNSFITISGWQVNGGEARRFFFTGKHHSYAQWRGNSTGKDLAANCGVIGAAYFWNQQELNQYYETHPIYRYGNYPSPSSGFRSNNSICDLAMAGCAPAPACQESKMKKCEEQAGTGMGERESNPTYQVAFNYDRGMFNPDQALVIYYGFDETPSPNPFPALGYAPEQP